MCNPFVYFVAYCALAKKNSECDGSLQLSAIEIPIDLLWK